jgi:RNA polymerase sigma factor (TIGR02999 family)
MTVVPTGDAASDQQAGGAKAYRRPAPRQASRDDRARFLAAAAATMRRVLVDHARRRHAARRGGDPLLVPLVDVAMVDQRAESLLALDEALTRLALIDARLARVVECRFFGGLTEGETAAALGVAERTVRRDWVKARGWLHAALARA